MKKVITLQVDEHLHKLLSEEAQGKTISVSALIRIILMEYFNGKRYN